MYVSTVDCVNLGNQMSGIRVALQNPSEATNPSIFQQLFYPVDLRVPRSLQQLQRLDAYPR